MRYQALATRLALASVFTLGASACTEGGGPSAGRSATNQVGEGLDGGIVLADAGGVVPSLDGGASGVDGGAADGGAADGGAADGGEDGGTGTSTTSGALTAGQLLAVIEAADRAEIGLASFVEQCSTNPLVSTFAQKMIADHTHFDLLREALNADGLVVTATSAALAELERTADEAQSRLETLSGAELDQAYIAFQVAVHERLLALIDASEPCTAMGAGDGGTVGGGDGDLGDGTFDFGLSEPGCFGIGGTDLAEATRGGADGGAGGLDGGAGGLDAGVGALDAGGSSLDAATSSVADGGLGADGGRDAGASDGGGLDLATRIRIAIAVARAELAAHYMNAQLLARLLASDDDGAASP